MTTPLDRLAKLATQRTARTDRLEEATYALLAQLDAITSPGDGVEVDGYSLRRATLRSDVGVYETWYFDTPECCVNLDKPVGSNGYIHGDFSCEYHGPSRADLIAFARIATKLIEAFIATAAAEVAALDAAAKTVADAAQKLG
jgi:hypothetical protein